MSTSSRIKAYWSYWLQAVDEHSLHSPFFYDLYTSVFKQPLIIDPQIEQLRNKLLSDTRSINVEDLGAGSALLKSGERSINEIARTSLTPLKYSTLYTRICERFQLKNILELGTSLGVNALYLSRIPGSKVTTFEGAPAIASLAEQNFEELKTHNIEVIKGNIDTSLPAFIHQARKLDFILVDANHRYAPTMNYVELLSTRIHPATVMVIDDIHHSREMEKAWQEIRRLRFVEATADIFRCGFVFFDPSLNKQHVVLQY